MKTSRSNLRKLLPGQTVSKNGVTYTRLENDGRWSINVMINRVRHHLVVGLASEGFTKTQADEIIVALKARKRTSTHGVMAPKHSIQYTLSKAAKEYLVYLKETGGKDSENKEIHFRLHLVHLLGDRPLDKLTDDDWLRYITKRRGEGASAATINRERSALLHMLNTAVKRKLLQAMPCHLQRQREPEGRIIYLDAEQLVRLLDAAENDQSPHVYPFVMIAAFTGMRHESVLALRAEQIDVVHRIIRVLKDKTGARSQPMPQILADYLADFIKAMVPGAFLFPSARSKRGRVYQINGQFGRCVKRAELGEGVTPHTMRHTMASNAAHAGVDAATIMVMGGWKTLAMVQRYTHAANVQTAMDKLESRLHARTITPKLQKGSFDKP